MTTTTLRPDQPPTPRRLAHRPVERGYVVPWFVAQVDGRYDFRIMDYAKLREAIVLKRCWLCGQPLGGYKAFVIGPMCAINRTIGDPPSHRECAEWAIRACPFLSQREKRRNAANLPDGAALSEFGIARQPGATCLWVTKSYRVSKVGDTVLFDLGDPVAVEWFYQARTATRAEVLASIDSGYPFLMELAEQDGPAAVAELEAAREKAMALLPKGDE